MSKTEFELNLSGLNELMKSTEMCEILEAAGEAVANAAGAEYGHRVHEANFVAICNVYPESQEAAKENFEENTLLKAIGAVGLSTTKSGG
jgi:hypothetical protein